MKYRRIVLLCLALSAATSQAALSLSPWIPIFKGVERAVGTNVPDGTTPINTLQVMNVAKVDLFDPDVQLFTTPRNTNNYVEQSRETTSLAVSNFLRTYKVQIACDSNFYGPNSDPQSEGVFMDVEGLFISQGTIVSRQDHTVETSVLMFTTNKQPFFVFDNQPPGTNTAGIYTAVCGHYPLIVRGQSVANDATSPVPGNNPRTAFGVSEDERYLFLLTIDGRQPGYSDGAVDSHTAYWLQLVGAYNAINMDGGGSTTLDMADCAGQPVPINRSSYPFTIQNRERYIGAHFGVYAKPLPSQVDNIEVTADATTATILWRTPTPATSQVAYGTTINYGQIAGNSVLLKNHAVTLGGLSPLTRYYFRISSSDEGSFYQSACYLVTSNTSASTIPLFTVSKTWKYTTNNQDGISWTVPSHPEPGWLGPGAGLLFVENNVNIGPKNTVLPYSANTTGIPVAGIPVSPTYYFRTHFTFPASPSGVTLSFSAFLDDCAVFYLNGTEIKRIRMHPTNPIPYTSISDPPGVGPCNTGNDATCADIFTVSGSLLNNLVTGDNVMAVELHQAAATSNDAVFGLALSYSVAQTNRPTLKILREGNTTTIYWNGSGFTLLQADDPSGTWSNVLDSATSLPVTNSTFMLQAPQGVKFYTLGL